MEFNQTHYVPCLRWKQGECQAVWRLSGKNKKAFTPLIEVPERSWDFAKKEVAKSIDEHLESFPKRVFVKWGQEPCFVDARHIDTCGPMEDGSHPINFIFAELRDLGCLAIPVISLDSDAACSLENKSIVERDKLGVCLRVTIAQAANKTLKNEIDSLMSALEIQAEDIHIVFDLKDPNFIPLDGFTKLINILVSGLPYLDNYKTFTILGTSFPPSMGGITRGLSILPRHEWCVYKQLAVDFKAAKLRIPTFGDYAIAHPEITMLDMRLVKPSATIRYTIDDEWCILKGKNVRDNKFGQYKGLSETLIPTQHYSGESFSFGDKYIMECANGGKTGNLSMWRQVGTNHHITKVLQDISNFHASSNNL